ncbi:hypothetical protein FSP39_000648 [Pinctada imbricata]|uniref:G-protein coupled receptors family 1 profile domain-containing protein n=1 Tax=Pinctada imbricata TaxID=66713 RepID=A0AA88XYI8_PINIB|nr:hypothetical protein FSP39_000648 [Pinctada imbricata]
MDQQLTQVTSVDDSREMNHMEYTTNTTNNLESAMRKAVEKGQGEFDRRGKSDNQIKKRNDSSRDQHEKINRKIKHKFTLMFMLITIIFLICYIPKVIIMLFEAMNKTFWESFSDRERAGVLFIYRMFIINNVSNPFVYAFLDLKFKNELKQLCCRN